jgi:capsular polysaccharide transport system permease protein
MRVELKKDTYMMTPEIKVLAEQPTVEPIRSSRLKSFNAFIVKNRSFIALVVAPFLVALIYFTAIASDRYVSTAEIIVKDNSSSSAAPSAMDFLLAGSSSNTQDALLVVNYIHSLDMARLINQEMNLKDYYKKIGDLDSQLYGWASQEDYLNYVRNHIEVNHDELSGIIRIDAQAFDPELAQQLVALVIEKSEDFVNAINHKLANQQMNFVQTELERAQTKLLDIKQQIIEFQNTNNIISPEDEAQGVATIIQGLSARLAEENTKLSAYRSYLNETSTQVTTVKSTVKSLEEQIQLEKQRLVGSMPNSTTTLLSTNDNGQSKLNQLSADFQKLQLQQQFALDAYQLALVSLESARIEASNKLKHLIVVTQASQAEDAEYPRKLYNLVTLAILLIMFYGIINMLSAAIKDHRT